MKNSDNAQIIDFLSRQNYPQGSELLLCELRPIIEQQFGFTIDDPYHALREAFNFLKRKAYICKTSSNRDGKYDVLVSSQSW